MTQECAAGKRISDDQRAAANARVGREMRPVNGRVRENDEIAYGQLRSFQGAKQGDDVVVGYTRPEDRGVVARQGRGGLRQGAERCRPELIFIGANEGDSRRVPTAGPQRNPQIYTDIVHAIEVAVAVPVESIGGGQGGVGKKYPTIGRPGDWSVSDQGLQNWFCDSFGQPPCAAGVDRKGMPPAKTGGGFVGDALRGLIQQVVDGGLQVRKCRLVIIVDRAPKDKKALTDQHAQPTLVRGK
ncbi:MAG: hypothetical protein GC155_06275 [Alphaproteobacteria bacterium]|nr:hypothetical protein [Alphaproteobacteria bacterium]